MSIELDLQIVSTCKQIPPEDLFKQWCIKAITTSQQTAELTIRIVDEEEGKALNRDYRHKDYATNVLSFISELPEELLLTVPLLGDLVICAPVVIREATEQKKEIQAHWAHMVTHGCLHLLGYDHKTPEEANKMETLETQLLQNQGYSDPYQDIND